MSSANLSRNATRKEGMRGTTIVELIIVATVILIIGGITVPYLLQIRANTRLISATAEVSDLMQQARLQAARSNTYIPVRFQTNGSTQQAWIDLNNDNALDSGDPFIDLPSGVTAASGAPGGTGGNPTNYSLVGDTSSGTPYDNSNVLSYSPRGLPCNCTSSPCSSSVCSTPASTYFFFYFQDGRPNGWSGVLVTKSGRTKALLWNGSAWH